MKKYGYAGLAAAIVLFMAWVAGYDFDERGAEALLIAWLAFSASGFAFMLGRLEELP